MDLNELFWGASLEELKLGYVFNEKEQVYHCLICGENFEKGIIYPIDSRWMDAEKAVHNHIQESHTSMFEFLIGMNKKYTGLTPHQKELLKMFYQGLTDKEIVDKSDANSTSTIRNQRFVFREKEKQAKVFLAIMELLNENRDTKKTSPSEQLLQVHRGATMVDERYIATEAERDTVLKTYFDTTKEMKLKNFPPKEKKKIIILQHIAKQFDPSRKYSEKEINNTIKAIYDDFATIRRYLLEYGFMERTSDGLEYWIKKS